MNAGVPSPAPSPPAAAPPEARARVLSVYLMCGPQTPQLAEAAVLQEGVFGTDARVVQAGGDRLGVQDLPVFVDERRRA